MNMDIEKFKKLTVHKSKSSKPEIVVVGRSNVGKSTLVRLLTKNNNIRVGKKPGVTLKINKYPLKTYTLVDLPGFGFMTGLDDSVQEKIKREIVSYVENRDNIKGSILVIDGKSFSEIVNRWDKRGEIPIDIEMFDFLNEVIGKEPIVIINKMDKIKNDERDDILDNIVETFGYPKPWRQWLDIFVPTVLKEGKGIDRVINLINKRLKS